MREHHEESSAQEARGSTDAELADTVGQIVRQEMGDTSATALREAIRAARGSILTTAAGAALTALGSALLLLGIFELLKRLPLPPWTPYVVAGALGIIVGAALCVVGRPRRQRPAPEE